MGYDEQQPRPEAIEPEQGFVNEAELRVPTQVWSAEQKAAWRKKYRDAFGMVFRHVTYEQLKAERDKQL